MQEPTEQIKTSFSLYPKHISFLNEINENTSLALRTVLDSAMRTTTKNRKRDAMSRYAIKYVIIGLLFFITAFLVTGIKVIIPTAIGAGILVYGLIECIGVIHGTVRRT